MKNWIIRTFRLKGSWTWAKKQMMQGYEVKCKSWRGYFKLRIDNPFNTLLMSNLFPYDPEQPNKKWEVSYYHISNENKIPFYKIGEQVYIK